MLSGKISNRKKLWPRGHIYRKHIRQWSGNYKRM